MARAKALPIARRLTARTDIKSADKPLLIEVCSLYHNGGRGVCDATNGHFAERLGEARETISRRLSRLASNGWLVINENKAAGFARTIVPTTQCLACYLAPEDLALLTEKSIAIDPKINSPLLTEPGIAIDQTGDPLLTIYGGAIDHLANSLLIVIEVAIKEQKERAIKEQAYEAASAALLEAEKKIAELEDENHWLQSAIAAHTGGGETDVATSVSPGKPVGPRSWVYDPAAVAENLRLPFASAEFRAAWVRYRTYREEMKYRRLTGGMMEQQQLDSLGQLAGGDEPHALALIANAIKKGWQDFYPLDKPYATAQQPATLGRRPAGAGRVETLPTYGRNRGPQAAPPANSPAGSAA
jgi:hypothetical protein